MMTLSEAAMATSGTILGKDAYFTSVGSDSRSIQKEQLFVAIGGENFNGHDYAKESINLGASAVMISEPLSDLSSALLVKDTKLALGVLSSYWRDKFAIPLIAITGSNGKTTVKEMLFSILSESTGIKEKVLATEGNLNNDIGLPMTLLKIRPQHTYAIAEMGMNHIGEIRYLSKLAKPSIALINNASSAHLGELGSLDMIAQAKGEIFEGLSPEGLAIINADDNYFSYWKSLVSKHRCLTFGIHSNADVKGEYELTTKGSYLRIKAMGTDFDAEMPLPGLHNVRNALAASCAALAIEISPEAIAAGLKGINAVKGRLQEKSGINGMVVIDDSYNANPVSVKAAIDVLAMRTGEKVLILGDMAELGEEEARLHAEVGIYAKESGITKLYALGSLTKHAVSAFGKNARHFDTPEELSAQIINEPADTVLIKGSRFMRMERVVNIITLDKNKGAQ